ncbi:flavin reductase [Aminobacter aminovorans]|uniref:FMN reductase (NADH) NtaB n=1 Tax=Aminobacter aminovorans TaxID=83263 RepID=A0AAC8YW05_AMIAI|nr:flavin reductase [Aminobacter aminovorans]AMS45324.1 FMN reductase (NADH) NtaB [Aminobacter aminovorans]MBB3708927.1 flavin reductase (DIM6/NTAB) family NADH-FMN oxidoreductase RutF/DNA-binding MarR family transcriptional regulator [Aminobacter aminovorans]
MEVQTRPLADVGDPALDPKAFRRALGSFPTGVTIITSAGNGGPVGVTANSFSSVSLDPPLVLWSLSHGSRSYQAFKECEHFAINVLTEDQVDVSQAFASASEDKFSLAAWRKGQTGSPLIDNALAYFDCVCEARYEGGDHTIMIGRVVDFARYEGAPLAFSQGRYGVTVDHPDLAAKDPSEKQERADFAEFPLLSLIAKAHYKVDDGLEERRAAAGFSPVGSKVLAGLYNSPPLSAEELSRRMYLDRREVDDSLSEFLTSGDVERSGGDRYELSESGRIRRRLIIDYLSKYQSEQLADISSTDLAIARRVLERFLAKTDKPSSLQE